MTDLQVRQGYANGTLTDCDECGETMKMGEECEACENRISCDQCAACMIQGVFCHETGCPNTHSRYDAESGEWIKQRKCGECGCTVDAATRSLQRLRRAPSVVMPWTMARVTTVCADLALTPTKRSTRTPTRSKIVASTLEATKANPPQPRTQSAS